MNGLDVQIATFLQAKLGSDRVVMGANDRLIFTVNSDSYHRHLQLLTDKLQELVDKYFPSRRQSIEVLVRPPFGSRHKILIIGRKEKGSKSAPS